MSYSFNVQAANKAEAKAAVAAKFEQVEREQPIHALDIPAALAHAYAVIDLMADDDTRDVSVSCNGYVSVRDWSAALDAAAMTAVSIGAQAGYVNRA